MKIRRYAAAGMAAAAALTLVAAAPASAAPGMARGTTTVVLDPGAASVLVGLGVSPEAPGTATVSNGLPSSVSFPIVGQIKGNMVSHTGGLDFSNVTNAQGGTSNVSVSHFIIDLTTGVLTGQATVDGMDLGSIPVFMLRDPKPLGDATTLPSCAGIQKGVYLSDAAAGALGVPADTFIGDACAVPTNKVKSI